MIKGVTAGDRVELKEKNKDNEIVTYISQVMDISEDGAIRIAMPIVKGKIVPLPKGAKYDAFFYSTRSIYQARVIVAERYKSGNIYSMDIVPENGMKKYLAMKSLGKKFTN